jgi:hypothetical protein
MVLDAVQLPLFDQRRLLKALREHETFDLGECIVGGDVTHYWVKRLKSGRKWRVTWTVGRRVRVAGTFTSEEVLDYFRSMDVRTITEEDWVRMGWRPDRSNFAPIPIAPVIEWKCFLGRLGRRGFSLTAVNGVTGTHLEGSPSCELRDGVDVYIAAASLAKHHEYPLSTEDLPRIAAQIKKMDPVVASQFRLAPKILAQREKAEMRREKAERQRAEAKRQAALRPFKKAIEAYLQRVPGYRWYSGSTSTWVRRFMENYALTHGRLPSGRHSTGNYGPTHDFSDVRHQTPSRPSNGN